MIAGSRDIAVLDQASRILAEAKSLDEIKAIRDKAEAARNYVRAAKLGLELQNRAAEVKLRAERKAGGLLRSMRLRGGNRRSKKHDAPLKLQDLGISRDQSKRWQYIASVSDAEFAKYLKDSTEQGREITSAALLRIARAGRVNHAPLRSPLATSISSGHVETRGTDELFEELSNHCRLLGEILRPVYEEADLELRRGEKRAVGHLLGEMTSLILQLKKTWPKSEFRH